MLKLNAALQWEIQVNPGPLGWIRYDSQTEQLIKDAQVQSQRFVEYAARGQQYVIDLEESIQVNQRSGVRRPIRCVELQEDEDDGSEDDEDGIPVLSEKALPQRPDRLQRLVDRLLSPAVVVPIPMDAVEEPAKLSAEQVRKVFVDHVDGVEQFLYREMPGQYALNFIIVAYARGLQAFEGTPIHAHLLWLMRTIVHYGFAGKPDASRHLNDVAEAFMDCQAVQGRVVERVGLEIRGVRTDFRGLVTQLLGEYKGVALKMLTHERIARQFAAHGGNPTHYENRLTADLGPSLGLNAADVRRAELDYHAAHRYEALGAEERYRVADRCRAHFDLDAFLKAWAAKVNGFGPDSPQDSLPRLFLDWASNELMDKHIVFDEATCMNVDVDEPFMLAVLEVLFLGAQAVPPEESYRGRRLCELFASGHDGAGAAGETKAEAAY